MIPSEVGRSRACGNWSTLHQGRARRCRKWVEVLSEQFCNLEGCLGLTDAQARLAQGGLSATPRQATRLLALQQQGIRLSWSALEVLLSEQPALLMLPAWLQSPLELRGALEEVGLCLRSGSTGAEVLSSDELWLESQETALVPLAGEQVALAMVGSPGGAAEGFPDSWRVVADAEDTARILEHLRSAFRQAQIQGVSPAPLLWLALKRKRPEVTREAARLAREHLDPDIGRHLEALFSTQPAQALAALRKLRQPGPSGVLDLPFLLGLLQLLWDQPELRPAILELIEDHTPAWLQAPGLILSWWEDCLAQANELDGALVQRLAQISLHWARRGLELEPILLRRLERGLSMAERLLAAWLLSQLPLSETVRDALLEHALELGCEPNLAGQALIRVEQILENLGRAGMQAVLTPSTFARLVSELRCWVVARALSQPEDRDQGEQLGLAELAAGSRRMLRQLSAMGWTPRLDAPGLDDSLRWNLTGFLEQEIPHLEPPDDTWAIGLLVRLEPAVLDRLYARACRDAESLSRAFPARLESWALHCAAADRAPAGVAVERLLPLSDFYRERPELWRAWALLLRCQELEKSIQEALLAALTAGQQAFPSRWPEWWEEIQSSAVVWLRRRAEADMLAVVEEDSVPRQTVQAVLETLLRRITDWESSRPLVRTLSQRLLFLEQEQTPQQRLRWALDRSSQGDGLLSPRAWDAEQRDLALGLLGRLALRSELDEELRRPLRVRCWQFIRDWLEGVRSGGDSYQHRSMPLWTTARALVPQAGPGEKELIDEVAQTVMTLQGSCPERLRLLTHSDCLGFLLDWALLGETFQRTERQRQVLHLLQELLQQSDRDYRPVAVGYLIGLAPERLEPGIQGEWQRLRQRWEGWLYGD